MSIELKIPEVGESVREVQIGRWLKHEGDAVAQDENVVELETDKASMELAAPAAGVLGKILKKEGDMVAVGDVIGYVEEQGSRGRQETRASAAKESNAATPPTAPPGNPPNKSSKAHSKNKPTKSPSPPPPAALFANMASTPPISRPAVPRCERMMFFGTSTSKKPKRTSRRQPTERRTPRSASNPPSQANGELEEVVPMSLIRRRIAERLVSAQQQAALLTTFNEIDMSAVKELRAEYRDAFQTKYGIEARLHVVLRQSRRRRPQRASRRSTPKSATTRSSTATTTTSASPSAAPRASSCRSCAFADRLSFAEIEQADRRLRQPRLEQQARPQPTSKAAHSPSPTAASSARSSPRRSSTHRKAASSACTPSRIAPSPANGQVVIRPMMYVALTYDHRLVDGREAVTFLVRIKEALEDPSRMLLEI